MPFEEIPHTADISLHVWASDISSLFEEAARGMYSLSNPILAEGPCTQREISLSAPDRESLLVSFLSELVFIAEMENRICNEIQINVKEGKGSVKVNAQMTGFPIKFLSKTIKAVTFHDLRIQYSQGRWETTIVFDV
jgi:SHS2 domain-containing protein